MRAFSQREEVLGDGEVWGWVEYGENRFELLATFIDKCDNPIDVCKAKKLVADFIDGIVTPTLLSRSRTHVGQ